MARPTRIEYGGAVYHVMARGNRGDLLYRDDRDRAMFLKTLSEACEKSGWLVHAYALMGTHYHIALETPEANLVVGMQWLQTTYTVRFNLRHELFGHLFAGRYKAIPVDPELDYFRRLIIYIHLNPPRAGLVPDGESIVSYPWSSLPHYLAPPRRRPRFLVAERGLGAEGLDDTPSGRRRYGKEVDQRFRSEKSGEQLVSVVKKSSPGEMPGRGWFFGGERFKAKLLEQAEEVLEVGRRDRNRAPGAPADHAEAMAERIAAGCLAEIGVEESMLADMRKGAPEKVAIAWLIRRQTAVRLGWIAERLCMGNVGNVSVHCGRLDAEDERAGQAAKIVRKLRNNLEFIT